MTWYDRISKGLLRTWFDIAKYDIEFLQEYDVSSTPESLWYETQIENDVEMFTHVYGLIEATEGINHPIS